MYSTIYCLILYSLGIFRPINTQCAKQSTHRDVSRILGSTLLNNFKYDKP